MSDIPENGATATTDPSAAQAQNPKITNRVLAQYIRDMSFENILAQKGLTGDPAPEVQVQVNLDARKRPVEDTYEIITKLNITSKTKESGNTLFVLELEYAGIFEVKGVPEAQMHPYLLIECPRITFPFVRRVVSDITRDGGFPALNLETIDFMSLYRTELARRVKTDQQQPAGDATVN